MITKPSQYQIDLTDEIRRHQQIRRRANRLIDTLAWIVVVTVVCLTLIALGAFAAQIGPALITIPVIIILLVLGFYSAIHLLTRSLP